MPYHVEISSSFHRARAFNLEQDELLRTIVGPLMDGRTIELGDREWEPGTCTLKVLEGPHLDPPALSFGQGWSNAERLAENVTRRFMDDAARSLQASEVGTFIVECEDPERTVREMTQGLPVQAVHWSQARERIDRRDPEVEAVVLVVKRSEPGAP
ncbi:MAG: hypothetical protein WBM00_08390 [Solirubrobacterales bacterium]